MEIQVSAKHFVRTFARQHHFNAHRFDFTRHQIHRCRGANGGHIVSFDVIDNVANRIQTFLHGEVNFMVHGAQMVCHFLRGFQIRRTFEAYGEGVQLRPPGLRAFTVFHATCGEFLGDGRDNG
ncbi:hypothetical protein D3C71_1523370 [compost metagenome]